ncbi:MAG: NAD-dependent epimerase/dehydratase family protein [Proteobacteria bacterium]|nr:NAD-dependent epimerase/dehydratase family protein [Pseudomonadota bacterium]
MTQTALVTGIGGFIGRNTGPTLEAAGWHIRGIGRSETGDLNGKIDWRPFLENVDAVIHLAARVHVMEKQSTGTRSADAYNHANRDATIRLGEQAKEAGVSRFIFMSSVKVHGERSDTPLNATSPMAPIEPYAIAKAEAESGLLALGGKMGVTILRPPLVYGPHVGGNFLKLIKAVERGVPLPLGAIDNKRSLIYVGNLTDAIRAALLAPPGIYLPSDARPVSTSELIRNLAAALGRPPRLVPLPTPLLRFAGRITGKSTSIQRLVDSLVVDGFVPDWSPKFSLLQGLQQTAAWRRAAVLEGAPE